jgi:DNA-binding response OmpR family regulator
MPDRRVLVLDDDLDITTLLTAVLAAEGYTVEPVTTATAAREKLAEGTFRVAVIDCRLPDDDGFEIARRAHELNVAVVLMSGEDRAIAKLPATGFTFLQKPFKMADLPRAVDAAIKGGR